MVILPGNSQGTLSENLAIIPRELLQIFPREFRDYYQGIPQKSDWKFLHEFSWEILQEIPRQILQEFARGVIHEFPCRFFL